MKPGEQSPRPQAHVLSVPCPNLAVHRPDGRRLQDEPVTHVCVRVAGLQRGAVSTCAPTFRLPLSLAASRARSPPLPRSIPPCSSVQALERGSAPRPPCPRAAHRNGRDGARGDARGRHLAQERGTLCLGDPGGWHQLVPLPRGVTGTRRRRRQPTRGGQVGRQPESRWASWRPGRARPARTASKG